AELVSHGVAAVAYHAGMSRTERDEIHRQFRSGRAEVVAATSAFGMGIDKPDVRAVIHASVPDSVDNYYQQIGRAGRDGKPAVAQLFYRPEDLGLARFFTSQRPDEALVATVYALLLESGGHQSLAAVCESIDAPERRITNALNVLEEANLIRCSRKGFRVTRRVSLAEAARLATEVVERKERIDRTRVEMMRGYAETRDCRRQFLLNYFGETIPGPCGNCDRCDAAPPAEGAPATEDWEVGTPVRHRQWGAGVVSTDDDRITVLFDDWGYRTLAVSALTGVLRRRR
ncbi:MAG: recombinase RecQ, partial [Mycobacterium sp.]|nr:recombinase RecQ [Mycobacterium sp.]